MKSFFLANTLSPLHMTKKTTTIANETCRQEVENERHPSSQERWTARMGPVTKAVQAHLPTAIAATTGMNCCRLARRPGRSLRGYVILPPSQQNGAALDQTQPLVLMISIMMMPPISRLTNEQDRRLNQSQQLALKPVQSKAPPQKRMTTTPRCVPNSKQP